MAKRRPPGVRPRRARRGRGALRAGPALLRTFPASVERDQRELELEVELGYALIPVRGWSAPETARAFTRAGDLCRSIGETPAHFRARWGIGAFHFVRGDQRKAREIADQCVAAARQSNDIDARMEAHYLDGIVSCAMGEFVDGQRDLEACVRIYGSEPREAHRVLYGQDAQASAMGWLAMARFVRAAGPTRRSPSPRTRWRSCATRASRSCSRAGWPPSASSMSSAEPAGPGSPLDAAVAPCAEQGFKYFHAVVSAFQGASLAQSGHVEDGIAMMQVERRRAAGHGLRSCCSRSSLRASRRRTSRPGRSPRGSQR
ncbi:MAG: hypothetical protein MZV65_18715 [Chromatiales bacterium]|nr:hypothetical protein [Chromatiales bacterium]